MERPLGAQSPEYLNELPRRQVYSGTPTIALSGEKSRDSLIRRAGRQILSLYRRRQPHVFHQASRTSAQPGGAIFDYTNSAALAFWNAYLRGDARAKQYLQSNA